ncbi:MAG: hypothetical protein Q8O93_01280 [bacterium]|nr:hypothetical protein [bacterium]
MILDKYLKFNLKNKIVASSVGFLLTILFLIFFIVAPTIKDIRAMGDEIEAQRLDLENKYIKGQSLKQLSENLKKIEPRLNLLDQVFINKNRELEFITSLESQANKNNIDQKINLSPPQIAENQNFQKTVLQLFTKSSFTRQLRYLTNLESLNYYINIKQLELSPAAEAGPPRSIDRDGPPLPADSSNINMYISADTYWN